MPFNNSLYWRPAGDETSEDSDDAFFGPREPSGEPQGEPQIKPPPIVDDTNQRDTKFRLEEHLKKNDLKAIQQELNSDFLNGFDIDSELGTEWNMLYHACYLGHVEIVQYLVEERGATINLTKQSETPLMVACQSEEDSDKVFQIVKTLMKETTIINSSNRNGVTPLMFASKNGHAEVVKYLLLNHDTYDAIDNDGNNVSYSIWQVIVRN